MSDFLIITLLIDFFISGMVAAIIGDKKQMGFAGTFILCMLLSPVIGGVIAYLSKDKEIADLEKKTLLRSSEDDTISKLERLADLKASGALTEEEYQQQKSKILNP
jgi:hypothetical protein